MRGYSQSHTFCVGPTMKKIPHAVRKEMWSYPAETASRHGIATLEY